MPDDERARFCADDVELGEIVYPAPIVMTLPTPQDEEAPPPEPPPTPPPPPKGWMPA